MERTAKHIHWRFMQMKITMSYVMRFQANGLLGINAVDLIRPRPEITNMISYHQYICAN